MNTYVPTKQLPLLASLLMIIACGGGGGGDSGGGPAAATNSPPKISGDPQLTISAGDSYSFVPTASDPDGDALRFSADNLPPWSTFNTSTGEISGLPFAGDIGGYAAVTISVSDGKAEASLAPFDLVVAPQQLGEANFTPEGTVTTTADGYQSVGTLVMDTGTRQQSFENADLTLSFDEEGNLLDLFGETELPTELTDNVSVNAGVKATVGMMTGAEINADPDFGIELIDGISYFVFYIGSSFDITVGDPTQPGVFESVTLEPPLSGQIVMIMDPTDVFLYRFASIPLVGEYGFGTSDHSLIPFTPALDFPGLNSFRGNFMERGSFDIGYKVFDFFNIEGYRVTRNPTYADIDWQNPLNSTIEFGAGLNGKASFAFSVLSVGLFSFDLATASTTFLVEPNLQQSAIALQVAPDVSWVPDWFHFVPATEVNGEAMVNANGDFSFELNGTFRSEFPAADLSGMMRMDNEAVTLAGATASEGESLQVSITFGNYETVGRVEFPDSYGGNIADSVSEALDRQLAKVEEQLDALEDAISDYEFEVSLRGVRESLPAIMDAAITQIDGVPGAVYTSVYDGAVDVMEDEDNCVWAFGWWCLNDVVDVGIVAQSVAGAAKVTAQRRIVAPRAAMVELKRQALMADDEALRQALVTALRTAYDNRKIAIDIDISYDFGTILGTWPLYKGTWRRSFLSSSNEAKLKTARDNAHRIQETSDIMISAQAVYDALPTKEIIAEVKREVEEGLAAIPIPEGLGYRAAGTSVTAFVTVDGVDHGVEFNVLNPAEVLTGVSDLVADLLVADEE